MDGNGFRETRKTGSASHIRIIWNIRISRVLATIIAGAGLAVSGLVMQTTLNNSMAYPSTLADTASREACALDKAVVF